MIAIILVLAAWIIAAPTAALGGYLVGKREGQRIAAEYVLADYTPTKMGADAHNWRMLALSGASSLDALWPPNCFRFERLSSIAREMDRAAQLARRR